MTIVDMESFGWLGSTGALSASQISYLVLASSGAGPSSGAPALITGPWGAPSVALSMTAGGSYSRFIAVPVNTKCTVGFYLQLPNTTSGFGGDVVEFLCDAGSGIGSVTLRYDASGNARIVNWAGSGVSTSSIITDGNWHYIELTSGPTTSDPIEISVDGGAAATYGSGSGQGSGGKMYFLRFSVGNTPVNISDIYVQSGSVSPLGPVRVECKLPTGNGTNQSFSANTGTAYGAVASAPPNGLTDYISSSTVGAKSGFTHGSLSGTGTVKAVAVKAFADRSVSPARSLATGVRSSSAESYGSGVSLNGGNVSVFGPTYVTAVFETDPNTSAAWTITNVNNNEMSVEVTA